MLVVERVVRVRREYAGDKAIKAIARDLRLSRKVLRKATRAPKAAFDYHRTAQPLPRIDPFQERLNTLLMENEARSRRDRLRMMRIPGCCCVTVSRDRPSGWERRDNEQGVQLAGQRLLEPRALWRPALACMEHDRTLPMISSRRSVRIVLRT